MLEWVKGEGMDFTRNYAWHPFWRICMGLKTLYFKLVNEAYQQDFISSNRYQVLATDYDIRHWLEFCKENIQLCPLDFYWDFGIPDVGEVRGTEIPMVVENLFRPLSITQSGYRVLFKYKGYDELFVMGFGSGFFELYGGLYLEARSSVIDIYNDSVALTGITKFKNYGEDLEGTWSQENIRNLLAHAESVEITDKMDGSFQQYRYDPRSRRILGSGSQALDPLESWRLNRGYQFIQQNPSLAVMLEHYSNLTFMFEFICTENPIVVHYTKEQEGLYLFAARNNQTGEELSFDVLQTIAESYNVKTVQWYTGETFDSILSQTGKYSSNEKEGWVVKIYDRQGDFLRVKLKTDDYVAMHRVLSNAISPNAMIEAFILGREDDFISKVPTAYQYLALEIYSNIGKFVHEKNELIKKYYEQVLFTVQKDGLEGTRKDFMLTVQRVVPKEFQGWVIARYLGRPVDVLRLGPRDAKVVGHVKYGEIKDFLERNK